MKRHTTKGVVASVVLLACVACVAVTFACAHCARSPSDEETSQMERCSVQISIDCGENFMFDKYDVDVFVDEEAVGSIEHGGEATYELSLPKGQHVLFFKKRGASVPEGRTSFFVEGEGDKFFYRIYCTSEEIDVETYREGAEEGS